MSKKFLTNVELEAGLVDGSNSAGTSGYVLSSTGTATSWIDPATIAVAESEQVHIACKNTSGVAISKGDPVYITGTVGTSFIVQIAKADASNSAKMPAVGLAESDLAINAEGYVIVSGVLKNITTDPLSTGDGTPSSNDTVYVKVGGGLTRTKPTGASNLIQNVGKVGRVQSTSAGSLAVSTIMRTNDVPNLNTGKIWVGSSTYTTESGVVHLDESNSRMGINTATPAFALDVDSGTVGAASIFLEQVSPSVNFYDLTFLGSIFMSSGQMGFQTNSSTRMVISSSGNVGIGTTSPGAKTHIYGPNHTGAFNTGALMIQQSSDNSRMFIDGNDIDAADGILFLNDYSLNAVRLGGDLQIPNGDIGIGFTTAPTQRLHVDGNVRVTGAYYDSNNSAGTSGQVLSSTATGTDWVSLSEISGVDGTGTANYIAKWSDADTITNSIIYDNGSNVGIGTSSPSSKAHIIDTSNPDTTSGSLIVEGRRDGGANVLTLRAKDASNPSDALPNGQGVVMRFQGFDGTDFENMGYIFMGADGQAVANSDAPSFMSFGTSADGSSSPSERMRIDSSGKVGIGTTSPSYLLQAQKNQAAYTYIASDNANAAASGTGSGFAMTESGSIAWYLRSERDGTGKFNIGNSENRLTIDSSGRVGIGTTSPSAKLDVNGDIKLSAGAKIKFNDDRYFTPENNVDGAEISANGIFKVKTGATPTERFRIDSSGNVGIGTSNPAVKLDVRDGTFSNSRRLLVVDNSNAGTLSHVTYDTVLIQQNDAPTLRLYESGENLATTLASDAGVSRLASSGHLAFHANGTYTASGWTGLGGNETMRITNNNVGIGTTSPAAKLDVSGNIKMTETAATTDTDKFIVSDSGVLKYRTGSQMLSDIGAIGGSGTTNYIPVFTGSTTIASSIMSQSSGIIDVNGTIRYDEQISSNFTSAAKAFIAIQSASGAQKYKVYKNTNTGDGYARFKLDRAYDYGSNDQMVQEAIYQRRTTTKNVRFRYDGDITTGDDSYLEFYELTDGTVEGWVCVDDYSRCFVEIYYDADTSDTYPNPSAATPTGTLIHSTNPDTETPNWDTYQGDGYFSGNVGIGTSSPNSKLTINGGVNNVWSYSTGTLDQPGFVATNNVNYSTSTNILYSKIYGSAITASAFGVTLGNYSIVGSEGSANNGLILGTFNAKPIIIGTNSSERMRIDSSGNVGIGTSSPTRLFHVAGAYASAIMTLQRTNSNSGGSYGALQWTASDDHTVAVIDARADGDNEGAHLLFHTTSAAASNDPYGINERMRITSTGNVGIGTTSPSYKLDVSGTIRATGDVIAYSDIRVKENIKTIDNALDKVKALRGVEYNKIDSSEKSIGVIAQEIEEVIPQVVKEDETGMKSVAYGNITAVLIEAIKEQQKQIDELKAIINGSSK